MSFEQAAEIGTEKVIKEQSTIGVMVTTDGSITDIPRNNYITAEERAVAELKSLDKPFVILLNCQDPTSQAGLQKSLEEKYGVPVVAVNVEKMTEAEILHILQKALFEFPVLSIDVKIPKWLQSFPEENREVSALFSALKAQANRIQKMRDCFLLEELFDENSDFLNPNDIRMDLGKGNVEIRIEAKENVFYRVLSEESGEAIENDLSLMQYVRALAGVRKEYDKVKDALFEAEQNGYGIVYPLAEEYTLDKPQLIKKSAGYGVQFNAKATSYHIVKVEVNGSVSPIIGTKQQSEEFADETLRTYDEGLEKVWETNIFGKSLRTLVGEELSGKSNAMPIELRKKMRRAVNRIVNEGQGNVICILF